MTESDALNLACMQRLGWTLVEDAFFKIIRQPGETDTGFCCGKHLSDDDCWTESGLIVRYDLSLDLVRRDLLPRLTEEQREAFFIALDNECFLGIICPHVVAYKALMAPAAALCRAFLAATDPASK